MFSSEKIRKKLNVFLKKTLNSNKMPNSIIGEYIELKSGTKSVENNDEKLDDTKVLTS